MPDTPATSERKIWSFSDAWAHPGLFQPHFKGGSWDNWFVFCKSLFGEELTEAEAQVFRDCTGRQVVPTTPFTEAALVVGRRGGKALDLNTPPPTPTGWTTMGKVQTGDMVYDERGQPCRVTMAHPVMLGRPCYRVCFSDGSEIIADEDHLWTTLDKRARKCSDAQ